MSRITEIKHINKYRTKEEMREALKRFCNVAWGNRGNKRSCFSIPPDDEDADIILSDAISELLDMRTLLCDIMATVECASLDSQGNELPWHIRARALLGE